MTKVTVVTIRPMRTDDLPDLWAFQCDAEANHMAAFTAPDPHDREAYITKWTRLVADPTIIARTLLVDGQIRGSVGSYRMHGERQVTYWIDRSAWGTGIATRGLRLLLDEVRERPLHARVAFDNRGSMRVLEKCGFTVNGTDSGYANARQAQITELLFVLR